MLNGLIKGQLIIASDDNEVIKELTKNILQASERVHVCDKGEYVDRGYLVSPPPSDIAVRPVCCVIDGFN